MNSRVLYDELNREWRNGNPTVTTKSFLLIQDVEVRKKMDVARRNRSKNRLPMTVKQNKQVIFGTCVNKNEEFIYDIAPQRFPSDSVSALIQIKSDNDSVICIEVYHHHVTEAMLDARKN